MASDLNNLIESLKRQRTEVDTEMNSTREQDAAELVDKVQQLLRRSEELDETCRRQHKRSTPDSSRGLLPKSRIIRAR
jgi:vacuolar-type H+-ATPase catalytic subunit A/Vma1